MTKLTLLLSLSIFTYTSDNSLDSTYIEFIDQDSQNKYGTDDIDNDSFFIEVESIHDATDGEILDESNMMGN